MDKSSDLREKLAMVNRECQTEYQGSQVLRDIMILVSKQIKSYYAAIAALLVSKLWLLLLYSPTWVKTLVQ